MTKSELKQKLEAMRDMIANIHSKHPNQDNHASVIYTADIFLPLLLDAYEALEWSCWCDTSECEACLSLARIEAFATQGAHEQSEFENGEK